MVSCVVTDLSLSKDKLYLPAADAVSLVFTQQNETKEQKTYLNQRASHFVWSLFSSLSLSLSDLLSVDLFTNLHWLDCSLRWVLSTRDSLTYIEHAVKLRQQCFRSTDEIWTWGHATLFNRATDKITSSKASCGLDLDFRLKILSQLRFLQLITFETVPIRYPDQHWMSSSFAPRYLFRGALPPQNHQAY